MVESKTSKTVVVANIVFAWHETSGRTPQQLILPHQAIGSATNCRRDVVVQLCLPQVALTGALTREHGTIEFHLAWVERRD